MVHAPLPCHDDNQTYQGDSCEHYRHKKKSGAHSLSRVCGAVVHQILELPLRLNDL
jgi:hypothetical protein